MGKSLHTNIKPSLRRITEAYPCSITESDKDKEFDMVNEMENGIDR
ncbi:hypothetical protein FWH09_01695 [Candidatus Saccharibacteria bacterium]|nr:hypothetical protein [Candidatus Saccharibacteria bacterium]